MTGEPDELLQRPRTAAIARALQEYAEPRFADSFLIIFGSYAYGVETPHSDVDAIAFCRSFDVSDVENFVAHFRHVCTELGASLRAEIPHELSLLISYAFLEEGIAGRGFERCEAGIRVPPRIRTPSFYRSTPMLRRFAFNAITSRNLFVYGDLATYRTYRNEALTNLVRLLMVVNNRTDMSVDELVDRAIEEGPPSCRRQGDYLGYKDLPPVRMYLHEAFGECIRLNVERGNLMGDSSHFVVRDPTWLERWVEASGV